jgi:hypothetical protein
VVSVRREKEMIIEEWVDRRTMEEGERASGGMNN